MVSRRNRYRETESKTCLKATVLGRVKEENKSFALKKLVSYWEDKAN